MPTTYSASSGAVAVGAAAGLIRDGNPARRALVVQNAHATQDLYLGFDSGVLTTTGLKVPAGQSYRFENHRGPVWGIASGAATDVRFLEEVG